MSIFQVFSSVGSKLTLYLSIGAIAVIIAMGAIIMSLRLDIAHTAVSIKDLQDRNAVLQSNNDILKTNLINAENANQTNQTTISSLIKERRDSQAAIDALNASKVKDAQYTAALQARIAELARDPKNDGLVSPVLAEAIRTIESKRGAK